MEIVELSVVLEHLEQLVQSALLEQLEYVEWLASLAALVQPEILERQGLQGQWDLPVPRDKSEPLEQQDCLELQGVPVPLGHLVFQETQVGLVQLEQLV